MAAATQPKTAASDYRVADLALAEWGRKEIAVAETEMPGLMAIREEYAKSQPLKGARISGSLHMTIQTAVLIETLEALGASVRWASCNIFSTQDHAAAAIAQGGIAVFAYKGETLEEYWEFTHRIFEWPDGGSTNMILDDGGDATLLVHLGAKAEKDASAIAKPTCEEERVLFAAIKKRLAAQPGWYSRQLASVRGVTEETTTGVHRLYQMQERGELRLPGDQRQRLGDQEQVRQPLRLPRVAGRRHQARDRRDGRRQDRGRLRLRRRGQGLGAVAARPLGARSGSPRSTRSARLQAAMEGYRVVTMEDACDKADIFVTATGNYHVITHDQMARMKDQAIVCNIGHFDSEIDVASLEKYRWEEIKPQVDHVIFPNGKRLILLAKGRLVNLGCATGHPSFVMSNSFTEPGDRADRAVESAGQRQVPGRRLHPAQAPGREGGATAAQAVERAAHGAAGRPGCLHRREQAGTLQVRPLPVLAGPPPRVVADRRAARCHPWTDLSRIVVSDAGRVFESQDDDDVRIPQSVWA